MKKILISLLLICMMMTLVVTSFGENGNIVIGNYESLSSDDDGVVTVGIYENLPLVGIDENGNPTGFFVDIMNYIAEKENINIEYELNTLNENFIKLENGELDLVLAIADTEARAKKYTYNTETVYTNWGQVYTNNKHTIESFLDLEDKLIGVETGDVHFDSENGIKNILKSFNLHVDYKEYTGRKEMLIDLEKGILDAGIVSRLYGEYHDPNFSLSLTPIQFNPIDLKIITADASNNYLLGAIDKHLVDLKADKESMYYQGLDNILNRDTKFYIPKALKGAIAILIAMLIASGITLLLSRKIIRTQNKSIRHQNQHLKQLLSCISTLSSIHNMDILFVNYVTHLRAILEDETIDMVSIIQYKDTYYVDSSDFVTNGYKTQAGLKVKDSTLSDAVLENLVLATHSEENILFAEDMIIVRYECSYECNGYMYIETNKEIVEKEFLSIYIINLLSALQSIIISNARVEEKTNLLISLGELIEKRDQFVANHVKRVSDATTYMARLYGYDDEKLNHITIASSVHDIGKIFVPDYILNKPGKLNAEEFQMIKSHTTDKFEFIDNVEDSLSKIVHKVVRSHHENWDGTGYPEGLSGETIPIEARLTSVIDVFEALTHKRSYKDAWSYEKAVNFIVDNSGIKFDPEIIEVFKKHSQEIFDIFLLSPDDKIVQNIN